MLRDLIATGIGVYVGGLYYFTVLQAPYVIENYKNFNKGTLSRLTKQILAWPITMPAILIRGNPVLALHKSYSNDM